MVFPVPPLLTNIPEGYGGLNAEDLNTALAESSATETPAADGIPTFELEREALHGYLLGQKHNVDALPKVVKAYEAWKGSHHDLAMDVATEESVLGDFDDAAGGKFLDLGAIRGRHWHNQLAIGEVLLRCALVGVIRQDALANPDLVGGHVDHDHGHVRFRLAHCRRQRRCRHAYVWLQFVRFYLLER